MRYYYDTEFHEDGKTIDFISIGMVAEDGREYYAVSAEFNTRRVAQHDWLMDNVMPYIDHQSLLVTDGLGFPLVRDVFITDPAAKLRDQIAQDIVNFIGNDPDPELWAWYCAYDHVCLAQLFGRMLDLPDNIPMFTNDFKTEVRRVERELGHALKLPKQPEGLHNALADAKHLKHRFEWLEENYGTN